MHLLMQNSKNFKLRLPLYMMYCNTLFEKLEGLNSIFSITENKRVFMCVDLVAGGFCFLYCLCQILLLASCTFYRVSNSIALLVHRILLYNIVLLLIKMSVFFIKKKTFSLFCVTIINFIWKDFDTINLCKSTMYWA
jgi:hypothetical protein